MARPGFVAWYRNPAQASQDSLGISYAGGGACRIMRPDFLFFSRAATGEIVVDIVDPHGPQFSDTLHNLRCFASYADTPGSHFRHLDSTASIGSTLRIAALQESTYRNDT